MARTPPRDTLHSTVRYVWWRGEGGRERREGGKGGRGDRRMDGGEEKSGYRSHLTHLNFAGPSQ